MWLTLHSYYFGVIKAYCEIKIARGKSKADIKEKIVYLEQEVSTR
jgi:hypothetical protein